MLEYQRLPQDLVDNLRSFRTIYQDRLQQLSAANQHAMEVKKQYDGSYESLQPLIKANEAVFSAFAEEQLASARELKFQKYCEAQQALYRQMF